MYIFVDIPEISVPGVIEREGERGNPLPFSRFFCLECLVFDLFVVNSQHINHPTRRITGPANEAKRIDILRSISRNADTSLCKGKEERVRKKEMRTTANQQTQRLYHVPRQGGFSITQSSQSPHSSSTSSRPAL